MLCVYEHADRNLLDRWALDKQHLHGFSHFALRIVDEGSWLQTLERENIKVLYDGVIDWPHSKSWYIKDPTGYEIEVVLWDDQRIAFEPLMQHQPQ